MGNRSSISPVHSINSESTYSLDNDNPDYSQDSATPSPPSPAAPVQSAITPAASDTFIERRTVAATKQQPSLETTTTSSLTLNSSVYSRLPATPILLGYSNNNMAAPNAYRLVNMSDAAESKHLSPPQLSSAQSSSIHLSPSILPTATATATPTAQNPNGEGSHLHSSRPHWYGTSDVRRSDADILHPHSYSYEKSHISQPWEAALRHDPTKTDPTYLFPIDPPLPTSNSIQRIHSPLDNSPQPSDDGIPLPSYVPPPDMKGHKKLSQWFATAICGNDITSSCFYVTGLCVLSSGAYAPICMLMVAATLYLFRSIYGESVTALPLNGGAYNVLLNTTSKSTAAIAACLTILSYMATGVVSAGSAIAYLSNILPPSAAAYNIPATVALLCFFALLCMWGITESADVALAIFVTHMVTLTVLVLVVAYWCILNGFPELEYNLGSGAGNPSWWQAIVFGFSSAMLGVSGFESSANFVEEQAPGVFILTLRNMWAAVAFFNPVIAFLSISIYRQAYIGDPDNRNITLALLGNTCGGVWLKYWVCIDAFLVLAGSVLTAFVGVNGLARRLALDRCLPQFLLAENKWRGTNHWIILGFLFICSSLYVILNGQIEQLANVYTISFLSVMSLFAIGNMLLKYKRGFLPRSVRASWPAAMTALALVIFALVGTIVNDAAILAYWAIYFVGVGIFVGAMFFRVQTLKLIYHALKGISTALGCRSKRPKQKEKNNSNNSTLINNEQKSLSSSSISLPYDSAHPVNEDGFVLRYIANTIQSIQNQAVCFFVKSGSIAILNKAILYVRQNEDCAYIRIVHIYDEEKNIPRKLLRNVTILDEAYPKCKIDLVLVKGRFGPSMIDYLSEELGVPKNLMFITCPKEDFAHKLESLGGVRLITH